MLIKTSGTTKDFKGMQFDYERFISKTNCLENINNKSVWIEKKEIVYIDKIFKIKAKTLKELKQKITEA